MTREIEPAEVIQQEVRNGINLFATVCARTATEKGFHQAFEDADWLERLVRSLRDDPTQLPASTLDRLERIADELRMLEIGTKLMLVVSELGEAFESLRDTGYTGHLNGEGNYGEELGDAGIRLGDLADMTEVTLGDEIVQKMAANMKRPHRHGRKL